MIYTEYETIYIARPELPDDTLQAISDKISGIIEKGEGVVLTLDDWGKRRLAYPIKKNSKGHYVYFNYVGPSSLVGELERNLRIDDQLLRFLTVKLGYDVDVDTRKEEAAEVNAKRAAARAARAAAEAEAAAQREEREAALAAEQARQAEKAEKAEKAKSAETAEAESTESTPADENAQDADSPEGE